MHFFITRNTFAIKRAYLIYNGPLQNKYCKYGRKYHNLFLVRRLTLREEYLLDTKSHKIPVKIKS